MALLQQIMVQISLYMMTALINFSMMLVTCLNIRQVPTTMDLTTANLQPKAAMIISIVISSTNLSLTLNQAVIPIIINTVKTIKLATTTTKTSTRANSHTASHPISKATHINNQALITSSLLIASNIAHHNKAATASRTLITKTTKTNKVRVTTIKITIKTTTITSIRVAVSTLTTMVGIHSTEFGLTKNCGNLSPILCST